MIRIYDIGNNEVMTYDHSSGEHSSAKMASAIGEYDLGVNKNSYDQQLKDYYDMLPEPPKNVWTIPSTGLYPGTGNPTPNRHYWSDTIPVWTGQDPNRPNQTKPVDDYGGMSIEDWVEGTKKHLKEHGIYPLNESASNNLTWVKDSVNKQKSGAVDPTNKQVGGDHYKKMKIQPMEYIEANDLNWAEGNVIKYVTRHSYKNGKEDLEKAIHMLEMIIKSRYTNAT